MWIEAKTRNYLVVAPILKEKSGEILGADIPSQNLVKFPSGIESSAFPSGVVEPPVNLGI